MIKLKEISPKINNDEFINDLNSFADKYSKSPDWSEFWDLCEKYPQF